MTAGGVMPSPWPKRCRACGEMFQSCDFTGEVCPRCCAGRDRHPKGGKPYIQAIAEQVAATGRSA